MRVSMKFFSSAILVLLLLSGCATSYQQEGATGGFNDYQVSKDTFMIKFRGNGYTKKDRAADFSLLRAAEVTLKNGYSYFAIIGGNVDTANSSFTTPASYNTYGTANTYGNTSYINATTYQTGGQTFNVSRHTSTLQIKCFKKEQKLNTTLYDAKMVQSSLKAQYNIK